MNKYESPKAFKTYVIREIYNGAVFERRVEMALAEDLEVERQGTPPDLSNAATDEQLVSLITNLSPLHRELTEKAIAGKGILNENDLKMLKEAGVTDAGKRSVLITEPQPGTLDKPALLETASVAGVEKAFSFAQPTPKQSILDKLKGFFR